MPMAAKNSKHGSDLKVVLALAQRVGGKRFAKFVASDARKRTLLAKEISAIAVEWESKHLDRGVVDLVDLYSAARQYCDSIDRLVRGSRRDLHHATALLVNVQVLLYEEIMHHLVHLKKPLASAIADLCVRLDRVPNKGVTGPDQVFRQKRR